ncbi:MAG: ABC transporter permease [Candidatus Kryptoniota bacterium]
MKLKKQLEMKSTGKFIQKIAYREIANILKDRDIFLIVLIAPLFYGIFYGSIYYHKLQTKESVVIVDEDQSEMSRNLIRAINSSEFVHVASVLTDYSEARQLFVDGKSQGIIIIPEEFEQNVLSGKTVTIPAYVNASHFLISNDLNRALNEVAFALGDKISLRYFQSKGMSANQAVRLVEPLRLDFRPLFNTSESYGNFILPGLLTLVLLQTLLLGVSESFSRETEMNSLSEAYRLSNRSIAVLIIGKVLPYTLIFSSYGFFIFTIYFRFFSLNLNGNWLSLATMTLLAIMATSFMALFISSFFKEKITTLQFLVFTSYPFFLVSGLSWPMKSLPFWLRMLTHLLPTTPYLQSVVIITQMNGSWENVIVQIIELVVLTFLYFAIAAFMLKKNIEEVISITGATVPEEQPL